MFEGFESKRIATSETEINLKVAGNGPPLLLLHGYPQTHAIWHKIAPKLAEKFNGPDKTRMDHDDEVHDLHAKIGQLTVERDFLARGLKR